MQIEIEGMRGTIDALKGRVMVGDIESGMRQVGSIMVPDDNGIDRGIRPRWGRVIAVGEGVRDIRVDDWVLIEHGRWSWGIVVETANGPMKIHGVDPKSLLVVSDKAH